MMAGNADISQLPFTPFDAVYTAKKFSGNFRDL
jgi:hypothetical protein